jgi:hypothetical protein
MDQHMLHSNVADIQKVDDLDVAVFEHLYDPKPPEIQLGEPQGVGYTSGHWENKGDVYLFYALAAVPAPFEGFLVVRCKDSGGIDMYGRARIMVR